MILNNYKRNDMRLIVLLLLALTVAGCGIKPGRVDPPAGIEKDSFPRTYPDPS